MLDGQTSSSGQYFIGLMSGTSVDSVDAVLARFPDDGVPEIVARYGLAPPQRLRDQLLALSRADTQMTLAEFGALDQAVASWFANAALALIDQSQVDPGDIVAIGSHGQTIWHAPDDAAPFSLQIGSASHIAARTGIAVVADFRNSDMAVGGQGAPLVCAFHRAVFARPNQATAVVNIGGIANITFLPVAAAHNPMAVTGFDSGPGNGLMDAWISHTLAYSLDANGRWAATGCVQPELLARLLDDQYFHRAPPKSTGREYFGLGWLLGHDVARFEPVDVQATLCELSAQTIAEAIQEHGSSDERVLLCGGGVYNTQLCKRLTSHLPGRHIDTTADSGVDPDWVEAMAFAWLAKARINHQPGNAPGVTGARQAVVLGGLYEPPRA